jgi:hypothetical protein
MAPTGRSIPETLWSDAEVGAMLATFASNGSAGQHDLNLKFPCGWVWMSKQGAGPVPGCCNLRWKGPVTMSPPPDSSAVHACSWYGVRSTCLVIVAFAEVAKEMGMNPTSSPTSFSLERRGKKKKKKKKAWKANSNF